MVRIETRRLVIRNYTADDWRDVQRIAMDYSASEFAKYDHPWPTDDEGVQGATNWFASGDGYLAVCLRSTGECIGLLALHPRDDADPKVYNLGYIFHSDYHGHGYATEACRAGLAHAFGKLGVERIATGTAVANLASCRLLERLRLRRPGERSEDLWTLTRDEWLAQQGEPD
ncbi:MAG TPA: GNAT family N-acetyltransferase [Armatimonadota bacterium]|nr:GNAT family N-acetyltransferase [Armatimonadota bacterium]HQK94338.1 GNAT family N-acetyltransferase [Armatimonadota bacterium]